MVRIVCCVRIISVVVIQCASDMHSCKCLCASVQDHLFNRLFEREKLNCSQTDEKPLVLLSDHMQASNFTGLVTPLSTSLPGS
jgi:hypothetical protein